MTAALGVIPPRVRDATEEEVARFLRANPPRPAPPAPPKVNLGARWPDRPVVRFDSATGAFESIRSNIIDSAIESNTQRALLLPVPVSVEKRIAAIQQLRKSRHV